MLASNAKSLGHRALNVLAESLGPSGGGRGPIAAQPAQPAAAPDLRGSSEAASGVAQAPQIGIPAAPQIGIPADFLLSREQGGSPLNHLPAVSSAATSMATGAVRTPSSTSPSAAAAVRQALQSIGNGSGSQVPHLIPPIRLRHSTAQDLHQRGFSY